MQVFEQLSIYETIAVITAILYVILAARENIWCWFWGIISCSFWAYSAFFEYQLFVDALLQLFYVGVAFVGIYQWKYGSLKKGAMGIQKLSINKHVFIVSGGFIATGVFGYVFDEYTSAAATYIDSFTTVFSVIATLMVVQKVLENWIYWIIIDLVYIYLYHSRGGDLFSMLFVLYTLMSIYGLYQWTKNYKSQEILVE